MRGYFFTNHIYMSRIQLGIQTAHCAVAMYARAINHGIDSGCFKMMHEYALEHMTKIVLEGGNCEALEQIYNRLNAIARSIYQYELSNAERETMTFDQFLAEWFPFAKFNEDEQSLNGAITCVGVVVPEEIYTFAADIRNATYKIVQQEYVDDEADRIGYRVFTMSDPRVRGKYDREVDTFDELGMIDGDIAIAELIAYARIA